MPTRRRARQSVPTIGGGAEQTQKETDEEVSGEGEGEADERFGVEGEAGLANVDADDDLQGEDGPEDAGAEPMCPC